VIALSLFVLATLLRGGAVFGL